MAPHCGHLGAEKISLNNSDVQKTSCFNIPTPSKQAAFTRLRTFSEEDAWAANLQETTDYVEVEKTKMVNSEGLKIYHREKDAISTANALLFAIPKSFITQSDSDIDIDAKKNWAVVGQSLRSINPELLESFCKWSAQSNDIRFTRKSCLQQWQVSEA